MTRVTDWVFVLAVALFVAAIAVVWLWPCGCGGEFVELDRAGVGTVLVRPGSVDAILGPGEVLLDDGAGTRHNASTQVVVGALRINVSGTAAQVCDALYC